MERKTRWVSAGPVFFRNPLAGRRLLVARLAWLSVVVPALALAVFGFAAGFADLTRLGPESIFAALSQANIDPALSVVVGLVLPSLLMTALGFVLFWKRPADPMVLLTSLALITSTVAVSRSVFSAVITFPALGVIARVLFFLGFGSMVLLFTLFPNGRSVPIGSWMAAPVLALIPAALPELHRVLATFPSRPSDIRESTWALTASVIIAPLAVATVCQVYRYVKVSTDRERLQAKWVILPLGLLMAHLVVVFVLSQPVFRLSPAGEGWAQLSVVPTTFLFPIGISAAILRYRLYDIERIVSRTVTYGLLTVLLFGVYAAFVFVFRQLVPIQSDLAVAGSTLAVAAVANPIRRRLQRSVDLRFNRTHADAARTLSEFTSTLREAGDLSMLASELQAAVLRTFQPDRLYVWVRLPQRPSQPQLR